MSDIGPELPPHLLAKRKRKQEKEAKSGSTTTSGATQPEASTNGEKRRRVLGPVMPPAPLDQRPLEPANTMDESSSDEDDGFGPTLPTKESQSVQRKDVDQTDTLGTSKTATAEKPKRDDWMMMPPKQDDLAARMDPSKQRARGFNTGKGARAPNPGNGDNSAWHETLEQKQKRLADEMMGVSQPSGPQKPAGKERSATKDDEAARKTREQIEKTRGPSLMDRHKQTTGPEADDDPSKRTFDREKDMGSGMRINHTQRQQMLNKASGFNSKFSGGNYL